MLEQFYPYNARALELDEQALRLCRPYFEKMEEIRDYNQMKMLHAFTECEVSSSHLVGTTGYGLWDSGRSKLEEVVARVMGAEDASRWPCSAFCGRGIPCWQPPAGPMTPWKG